MKELTYEQKNALRIAVMLAILVLLFVVGYFIFDAINPNTPPPVRPPDYHMSPFSISRVYLLRCMRHILGA